MKIFGWNIEFYNPRRHAPVIYGVDRFVVGDRPCRPFATADIQGVLMMITNRMRNVVYQSDPQYLVLDEVFKFLHDNALAILLKFFYDGEVVLDVSDPFHPRFVENSEKCKELRESDLVWVLDEVFRTTGKTRSQTLAPQIEMLNTVNDSDLNLIMNYGAMGILSPENSAQTDGYLDDDQVDEIQKDYREKYGVRFGRWALLITKRPVKFQRIDLPIKELELSEKRKTAIAEILQYMNVPKELHAFFDSAKYANRNEAELDMYSNTVTAWAWVFVEIARRCYERIRLNDRGNVGYPAAIDIWFDIVGVAALQEAQQKEKEKAREELKMWQELKAQMPERADEINERIEDLIENL